MAAARAVLQWEPITAHVSKGGVHLVAFLPSYAAAPYLQLYDAWRQAGIGVTVKYLGTYGGWLEGVLSWIIC